MYYLIVNVTVLFYKSLSFSYLVSVSNVQVVADSENSRLPELKYRLKTLQYRDLGQTSCHNKSADSLFGRYTVYSVSYGDQLEDLRVALRLQRIECSMAGWDY